MVFDLPSQEYKGGFLWVCFKTFACGFIIVGGFFLLLCVRVAQRNGKPDGKEVSVVWSSRAAAFLRCRAVKSALLKRSRLNYLCQMLWLLPEKLRNKCPQQNPIKTFANR